MKETRVSNESCLEARARTKWRVSNGATRGARGRLGMLVTGRWEARDGLLGRTLDLRGSRTQVPLGLAERRLESKRLDLVLEISWANKCVALVVQIVSRHRGRLP